MSFILDALKKSELERQRQVIPGLMNSKAAHARRRLPLWAIGLMLLLGINLTVLTVVLTRSGAPGTQGARPAAAPPPASVQPAAAPPAAAHPAAATKNPTPAPDHFSPLDGTDAAPVYAPEIPVTAGTDAGTAASAPAIPRAQGGESSGREFHRRDPLLSALEEKADNEVLPTISEINTGGQEPLPEMHLDVHVYATDPADRFVYINGHKYHEGSTLQEGPTVERIRRDGVVLDSHGLRFLLPRQQ